MIKLGNSLATTVNHYNSAGRELGKVDKDVLRITGEQPLALGSPTIDRPCAPVEGGCTI
jgi:DNA recombination protein RmuC